MQLQSYSAKNLVGFSRQKSHKPLCINNMVGIFPPDCKREVTPVHGETVPPDYTTSILL